MVGNRRNVKNLHNSAKYFVIVKCKEAGANTKGVGTRINSLTPDVKMHILLTVLHKFRRELVRRI